MSYNLLPTNANSFLYMQALSTFYYWIKCWNALKIWHWAQWICCYDNTIIWYCFFISERIDREPYGYNREVKSADFIRQTYLLHGLWKVSGRWFIFIKPTCFHSLVFMYWHIIIQLHLFTNIRSFDHLNEFVHSMIHSYNHLFTLTSSFIHSTTHSHIIQSLTDVSLIHSRIIHSLPHVFLIHSLTFYSFPHTRIFIHPLMQYSFTRTIFFHSLTRICNSLTHVLFIHSLTCYSFIYTYYSFTHTRVIHSFTHVLSLLFIHILSLFQGRPPSASLY